MPYKYIGRTTNFRGKPLWEILGNLKNFGVGRLLIRSNFEHYPEKTFFKVLQVEALPSPKEPSMDDVRKVRVIIERTFRGVKDPKPVTLESASYKTDYRLIPKDEEHLYTSAKEAFTSSTIMPKYADFPPALAEYFKRMGKRSEELKLEMVYSKKTRVAQEGEKPTVEIPNTLNMQFAPELYKDVKI